MTTGSDTPIVGVGVAIVDEGKILLVQRANDPGKGLWAVPGGKVDHGETLREAAVREVLEETGLDVEVSDVVWAGEHISDHGHIVLIDFLGTVRGGSLQAADDADRAEWVPVADATGYPLTETMYDLLDLLALRHES